MLVDSAKKIIATGLGLAIFTKEKASELIRDWVNEGQLSKEEGEALLDSWLSKIDQERNDIQNRIRREVNNVIEHSGMVTRAEYQALEQRVAELEKQFQASKD